LVLSAIAIAFAGFIDVFQRLAFTHWKFFHHRLRVNDFIWFG
jgi:hypothetical protein